MGMGSDKVMTLVVNLETEEEIIYESRLAACKATGIKRKAINSYIEKGFTFNKKYKYYNFKGE